MSKRIPIMLIFIFLFVVGYLLSLTIFNDVLIKEDVVESSESSQVSYKDEKLYKSFMYGCINEGGNEEYCDCGYSYLRKDHTVDQLIDMFNDVDLENEKIPEWAHRTSINCLHLYEYVQTL